MFLLDIAYEQPWFDPIHILQDQEKEAFRAYFGRLDEIISGSMLDEPDLHETSLTTTLVNAIKGTDGLAKRKLDLDLDRSSLEIRISARELRGRPAESGELLDFAIEVRIGTVRDAWLHKVLLVEAKRLYPWGDVFTPDSQFMELNRPEKKGAAIRVRSAVQAKTMMETHGRAGAFFLYCPRKVGRRRVGIRVLFPETVCLLPRQPSWRQVSDDTLSLHTFMIEHFFTGRRGLDVDLARAILVGDSTRVSVRYHCVFDLRLPEERRPDVLRDT